MARATDGEVELSNETIDKRGKVILVVVNGFHSQCINVD